MRNLLKINIGIIFISLLVLIFVLSSMIFITASFVKSGKTIRGDAVAKEQAYYNSLSGVEYAYYEMLTDVLPRENEIKFGGDGSADISYDAQSGFLSSVGSYNSIDDNAEYVFSIKGPRVQKIVDCLIVNYEQMNFSEDFLSVNTMELKNICDNNIIINKIELKCKTGKLSGKVKKIVIDDNIVFYDESGKACGSKIKMHDYKIEPCQKLKINEIQFEKPVDKTSVDINFDFE